jgi:hypothetical protein
MAGLLVSTAAFMLPAAAQTVYRAVDELGNPAFTDRPEEYPEAEAIAIQVVASNRRAIAQKQTDDTQQAEDDAVAQQIRDDQAAEDAAAGQQAEQDAQTTNCNSAKKRFDKYKSARRLYREKGDGEREYLSEEETDKARVEAKRAVDQWCGD